MSSQGNGQPREYDVRMSGQTREQVKALHAQLAAAGRGAQFLAAFREIVARLKRDPREFGEPLYRLPVIHMQVRHGVVSFVAVDYAVHETLPLVLIRGLKSLL